MRGFIKNHGLSIILIGIFAIQSILGGTFYYKTWSENQADHGGETGLSGEYWNDFFGEYFISILADTYGAVLLVLLTKKLYEKGSAESKKG